MTNLLTTQWLATKDGLSHAGRVPIALLPLAQFPRRCQEVDGARKLVAANYVLRSKKRVGIQKPLTAIEI